MRNLFFVFTCLLITIPCAGEISLVDINSENDCTNSLLLQESARRAQLEYVPNEIIVKFRKDVAEAIEEQLAKRASGSELELVDSLDKLNKKYKVRAAEALCKDFKKSRQRIKELLKTDKKLLTKKERRILRRLNRAPKGVKIPDLGRIYKIEVELESGQLLEQAVGEYKNDPDVEYAELNYIVSICKMPNDPLYSNQWALPKIDAPEAWDINTGSSDIVIAVVDTGVDYTHRDQDDSMWTNKDGYYGYDFINNDNDPIDDHGHGTHCAGIIAAESDNGFDIAGINWHAKIMALKFLGANGKGSSADAVKAFYYAVNNGADVVSNSWSGGNYMKTMEQAIDYAHSQGVIMVAAAGNGNTNNAPYPAKYQHMLAVAATDSADKKAGFSNYGDWVDVAAPGVSILSLRARGTSLGTPYDSYTTRASGTSMSCPHVAAVAALIISQYAEASIQQVITRLLQTADGTSDYEGLLGTGRLNAHKAVREKFEGVIIFDSDAYLCNDIITIKVVDLDIMDQGTQDVILTTDGDDLETVTLIQDVSNPWLFTNTIHTSDGSIITEDGVLQISHGQIITAEYYDVDNGSGISATAETTARIDCQGPDIFNVEIVYVSSSRAVLSFETDEPTQGIVHCGLTCGGPYIITEEDLELSVSHTLDLFGLTPETDYYFVIGANDVLNNSSKDDNGGVCYSFTTRPAPAPIYVPGDFSIIQAAIDAATRDVTIIVADGIYTGDGNQDIDFRGKAITLRSENGPENYIIDCQGTETEKHRAFYFHSGEKADSVVDGFTVTNSTADQGAIYCYTTGELSTPSSPTITNCIITNNHGLYAGGLRSKWHCTPNISNCIITGNSSFNEGGGLKCSGGIISNCIISDNRAAYAGGIMCTSRYGRFIMNNCVIIDNVAAVWGGGIWIHNRVSTDTVNCIIRDNSGGQIKVTASTTPSITYCNIEGGWSGEGNIDADPMFVNAEQGNYHLLTGSPCINTGDPHFVGKWYETDIDGEPRVLLGRVDMGVDEYTGNVRPVADAGPDQTMSSIPPLITLDGSCSYSTDGDILNYHWEQISGPAVDLSDLNAVKPSFVPLEFGVYVFKLVVDDRIDDSLPDTVGIVIGNNHAPVADAGPLKYAASKLILDGTASFDPDGYGVLTYQWQQVSGPITVIINAKTATPTVKFTQTSEIQECEFELIVSDGDLTSQPDIVRVVIVPSFGSNVLYQFNPPFDPNKPAILTFGSFVNYNCSMGVGMWMYTHTAEWVTRSNFITVRVASYYSPPYERYGDMLITYLSQQAPNYKQAIQTIGYRTGGMPAIDVANHLNLTYADPRYAVNRVTLLGATCRDYTTDISTFNSSAVDNEQCWIDNYYLMDGGIYPGGDSYPGALNVYFATDDDNILIRGWYEGSLNHITWPNKDMYSDGFTAGGPVSAIGICKNLQLAKDETYYYFDWYNEDPYCSGLNCPKSYLFFHDETSYPGRLPEPVTLIGPPSGTVVDANGSVLSCEESQNAVGYQLLFGPDPQHMDYLISDTNEPPTQTVSDFPFKGTYWTIRATDQFGTTIHADPRLIKVKPIADAGPNQTVFAGADGMAEVTLDGTGSYDGDGHRLTYNWTWVVDENQFEAHGPTPLITLPVGEYIITLIVNDRVEDSEPDSVIISVLPPVEAEMKITPQRLNCKSKGNWVKAHVVLSEGFTSDDVDVEEPAFAELPQATIDSEYIKVLGNDDGLVRLEIAFDRHVFCELLMEGDCIMAGDGSVEITVVGYLTTGQYFYGSDSVRIKH